MLFECMAESYVLLILLKMHVKIIYFKNICQVNRNTTQFREKLCAKKYMLIFFFIALVFTGK
jgi:hypothetical protein